MIGFDNYVKGANAAVAQRRKTGLADQNRVFSRSSVSYNPAAAVCPLAPLPRFHLSGFWPVLGGLAWHDRANCLAQPGLANTRLHARANANVEHLWRGPGRPVGGAHSEQRGRRRREDGRAEEEQQEERGGPGGQRDGREGDEESSDELWGEEVISRRRGVVVIL